MAVPFAAAFLAGEARAEPFLARDFARPSARIAAVKEAARRKAPPELIAALEAQQSDADAVRRNLDALRDGGAAAVVTGQQVGLFLGPLYTLHKALTAVAVAKALEAESGVRCVPIFWLQTEDHDFAEIDHCVTLDASGGEVMLKLPPGGIERQSVEHQALPGEVSALVAKLGDALGEFPHAGEVRALFEAHYRPGVSIATAFQGAVQALMRDEGLIVFDPRRPEISRLTAPVHAKALRDAQTIGAALSQRSADLEAAGFDCQIAIREGCPLSFFHPDGVEGPRFRLNSHPDGWSLPGRAERFTTDELLRTLQAEPMRFSTSALLRPIVQDTLLPTAAYVGGPGELSYFAQLAPLYRHFGLPMPLFVPRARFRLIDARTRRQLGDLKLTAAEVEAPRETVLAKLIRPANGPTPEAIQADVVSATEQVLSQLETTESEDVKRALTRTRATISRAAGRLALRYRRSYEDGDRVTTERVDRLQRVLFPHGEPQERVLGLASFAAHAGIAELKRALFAALEPFGTAVKDVHL